MSDEAPKTPEDDRPKTVADVKAWMAAKADAEAKASHGEYTPPVPPTTETPEPTETSETTEPTDESASGSADPRKQSKPNRN
jgi:hypothetical protein